MTRPGKNGMPPAHRCIEETLATRVTRRMDSFDDKRESIFLVRAGVIDGKRAAARASMFATSLLPTLTLTTAALLATAGCSSTNTSSQLKVDPVTFTDANGTAFKVLPTSIAAGQSIYVDVQLSDDPQGLGANWSVYCGNALPVGTPLPPGQSQDASCGTFTPAHTMSAPVPSYVTSGAGYVALYNAPATAPKKGVVTLYASATSNPSRISSATLTILALPIPVSITPAPPAFLITAASTQLNAVLSNDKTNAGVSWTVLCGSSDCGSFSPTNTTSGVATTYTAPASIPTNGTVQVTATSIADPVESATATIELNPASN